MAVAGLGWRLGAVGTCILGRNLQSGLPRVHLAVETRRQGKPAWFETFAHFFIHSSHFQMKMKACVIGVT